MKIKLTLLLMIAILFTAAFANAAPYPADLDTTFGSYGGFEMNKNVQSFGVEMNGFGELVQATTDEIIVYDPDGRILRRVSAPKAFRFTRVAVLPNNSIIAVGTPSTFPRSDSMILAKYDVSLKLDQSFGTRGLMIDKNATPLHVPISILVQPDGKILISGSYFLNNLPGIGFLARYESNGSIDKIFGTDGKIYDSAYGDARNILLYNSNILVGGVFGPSNRATVMYGPKGDRFQRFNNGNPIASFGGAIAIQPDGKIVTGAPTTAQTLAIARFLPDGSPDWSFGLNGIASSPIPNFNATLNDIKIDAFGRIVVAGLVAPAGSQHHSILVARFLPNGSLDTSFTTSLPQNLPAGAAKLDFGISGLWSAFGITFQGQKILIVAMGCPSPGSRYDTSLIARLNG